MPSTRNGEKSSDDHGVHGVHGVFFFEMHTRNSYANVQMCADIHTFNLPATNMQTNVRFRFLLSKRIEVQIVQCTCTHGP